MPVKFSIFSLATVLFRPKAVFDALAVNEPSAAKVFFGFALWIGVLPPLFAYIGTMNFGWRLGVEPVFLPQHMVLAISAAYFAALLLGFLSSAVIARWMAITYDASQSLGRCFALMAIVGAPLAVGSVIHLYPHAFINVLVLVPTLIWSMYLLYRGLPVVLQTGPNRGMLMASALIAYLLVAAVSLLGVTVALWGSGLGPLIGY
ncbi:MAG: YIP1 family protein [Gammaproteobacteria bacterium]|nr:YIP1 family protein [Gammaproteobacteria bacterium]